MCRNCSLPEWREPVRLPVKELPEFFAKQISWNFERLNFGSGAIVETESGRSERPSVTGKTGCKLKETLQVHTKGRRQERHLLVSECMYCPGKRYGCTPRSNCTGKRRHCYAMCKVSIYGDAADVAEVSFAGSHGRGNVTDPSRHRTEQKRRRTEEGLNSSDTTQWKSPYRPTMVESLVSDQLRFASSSEDAVSLDATSSVTATCTEIELINTESGAGPQSSGGPDKADQSVNNWAGTNGTKPSTPDTPSTPLNTPLSHAATLLRPSIQSGTRGSQARFPTTYVSPRVYGTPKMGPGCSSPNSSWKVEAKSLASRTWAEQVQDKDQEILTLQQHIHILQEEHLNKISRVAELEAELHLLKEREIPRLEQQVQRLETEGLKKDVKILQLEKQLQAAMFSRSQTSASQVVLHVQPVTDGVAVNLPQMEGNDQLLESYKGSEEIGEESEAQGNENEDLDGDENGV